jgi:hypothetical protein
MESAFAPHPVTILREQKPDREGRDAGFIPKQRDTLNRTYYLN